MNLIIISKNLLFCCINEYEVSCNDWQSLKQYSSVARIVQIRNFQHLRIKDSGNVRQRKFEPGK